MTPKILAALKERSKPKKALCKPLVISKEQLNTYSKYCSEIFSDAKR